MATIRTPEEVFAHHGSTLGAGDLDGPLHRSAAQFRHNIGAVRAPRGQHRRRRPGRARRRSPEPELQVKSTNPCWTKGLQPVGELGR
jgi:hypothetical protein